MQEYQGTPQTIRPESTTSEIRPENVATIRPEETTAAADPPVAYDESVRILTDRPKGRSMYGRKLKKSEHVRSPFVAMTRPKRPKLGAAEDVVVDESTEIDVDPMRGIDDPQLSVELHQWMAGVLNVNRPMKFVPSFYKIILGQEQNGWLADEVSF